MIKIGVRVTGLKELINSNEKAMKTIDKGTLEERIINKIIRRAKYRAPRKTGDLVRSIHAYQLSSNKWFVICDVPYAAHLEFGTRYIKIGSEQAPRVIVSSSGKTAFLPFIRPAIWKTEKEIPAILTELLKNIYK